MADIVEHINGSLIQHGTFNNRIYLMHLNTADTEGLIAVMDNLALENGYAKIIAKIPATAWPFFKSACFLKEAVVPGFFNGLIDGYFIAKYFSSARSDDPRLDGRLKTLGLTGSGPLDHMDQRPQRDRAVFACRASDAAEMSALYRKVFKSYPFPIQRADYLKHTIAKGVRYFGMREAGRLIAVAATEIDIDADNAEMTDFATQPKWRKRGLAGVLLDHMERRVSLEGIQTAYTIARAGSIGMNRVFEGRGYRYAGGLKNNTQIGGRIESMVVWYKRLR